MPRSNAAIAVPDFALEDDCGGLVCGIDEAGRGPLAGPVIAACVHIPDNFRDLPFLKDIRDSKKLTARKRDDLFARIKHYCFYGVGTATAEEIDALNIHHATLLAMRRAFQKMNENRPDFKAQNALVDGKFVPDLPCAGRAVVGGDSVSMSIAAASIIAKVTRDRLMTQLDAEFPAYGWARNAGYGTAQHLAALKEHGVTPHHRRSYAPVREAC